MKNHLYNVMIHDDLKNALSTKVFTLDIADSTVDFHSSALSQSMSGICSLAGTQIKDLKGLETWRSPSTCTFGFGHIAS